MKNLRAPVLGLASCCRRCAAPWLSSAARPAARRRSPGTVPVFQHLASPNATAAAPFPPERTAWLVTLPLIVIDHAQGQGYMYGPKPTPGLGGEYGPALYNPAALCAVLRGRGGGCGAGDPRGQRRHCCALSERRRRPAVLLPVGRACWARTAAWRCTRQRA